MIKIDILKTIDDKKQTIEGSMIGCFVNDPDLIAEYPLDCDKLSKDGKFYYILLNNLYQVGYQKFDEVSTFAYLQKNQKDLEEFENKGGYKTLRDLAGIVNVENIDGYADAFNKYCLLKELHNKGFNIEQNFEKFNKMTASQVYDFLEYQLNSVTVDVASDIEFESFEITNKDIEAWESGEDVGIQYGRHCHLMNHMTLGFPKGDFTIVGSYVNQGKSSLMSYIINSIARDGTKVGIIANEMDIRAYKILLLMYVLTEHLDCYNITRKKIKMGKFTLEDKVNIQKATEIIKERYVPNLFFAKTFDYDFAKTKRIIKKWSKIGVELIVYDTLKASMENESTWQSLIESSRGLYQIASKENIAIVGVMQLALHAKIRRILDLDVLANGKQASEPASECIFFRNIQPDEYAGEKNEIKCYNFKKDSSGKYTNVKEMIELSPDKTYRVFFIAKTRNDEVGKAILYEFKGHLNIWKELGFADVRPDSY